MTTPGATLEDLLRELAPQVLGAFMRRFGDFPAAEDAVQEALLDAAVQWPRDGVPDDPRDWLIRAGNRRMTDLPRGETARDRRSDTAAVRLPPGEPLAPAADTALAADQDDTLTLLFLCCHPCLGTTSQIALTLRAVGGLTTAEIARAFLVPETTMSSRISRAKQRIRASGEEFRPPAPARRDERLRAVLHVLYLVFTEGCVATSGEVLPRAELADEAIRLTRLVHRLVPQDGEAAGLLALMLLTEARQPARTAPDSAVIPLAEQDRGAWDAGLIAEGTELLADALSHGELGPYQVQAAIAAVHDEAPTAEDTDWPQILALYGVLQRMAPNPAVTLDQAVAAAMVIGPEAGLAMLDGLPDGQRVDGQHRRRAVRAYLLEMAGEHQAAHEHYRAAARSATNDAERGYLESRAARISERSAGFP